MDDQLTTEERQTLLRLARDTPRASACAGSELPPVDLRRPRRRSSRRPALHSLRSRSGVSCAAASAPWRPTSRWSQDVREHALAAALEDPRFPPVRPDELDQIEIEISRLTPPQNLEYRDAEDLVRQLRPNVDGVILRDGPRRATFLPQVWEKIPGQGRVPGSPVRQDGSRAGHVAP